MRRARTTSARVLGCFLLSLLALLLTQGTASAQKAPPNVLFIAVDDLNDWVGCLGGHPQAKTPNIDKLAQRGVLFTRAYCAAPACNPSRAALLSGKRPSTTGIYHNNQPWQPVLKDVVTLPQHFQQQGYHVVAGGKLFHGQAEKDPYWNERFIRPGDPRPKVASVSGLNRAQFDWGPVAEPDEKMGDYHLVNWAAEQLGKKHDKPFFLAVGFIKPHLPWYVPQKYFDLFPLKDIKLPEVKDDDLKDVPPLGLKMARPDGDHAAVVKADQWRQAVQGYLATIAYTDGQIGRLLDAFDKSPYARNTIIVFWGDHGWHLGQKHHWRKFTLWEEATKAPLIVVAPGVTKPDGRCDRTVDFMHLYPTLCDLCGLPTPKHVEGTSLKPLLANPKASWDRPALTTHGRENHAVRSERYRYIRYSDGTEELYDHDKDPREWTNLAGDPKFADVKKELAKALPRTNAPDAPQVKTKDGDN